MIVSSVARCLLLIGYVVAVNINLKEYCNINSFQCTVSDCLDEVAVLETPTKSLKYPFTEIVFRHCYLPNLPSTIFSIAPKLEQLVMYKCSLRSIQQITFYAASNLKSLYLINNRLTELPEKVFSNLSQIEQIRLGSNHISHIHPKAFKGLSDLRFLDLNNNKMHELASGVFENLTNLEYIDLSFNDLETLDIKLFQKNINLKTVILNNNNFSTFQSNLFIHLPHLQMLDISYNNINKITLQSVDTLRAQNSQLRSFVINGSVIKARVSNNQLKSITITDKSSVKEIDVHNNQFETLSDFQGMLNLQKLDISKNQIKSLNSTNTTFLVDLPSLQYLNVAYGNLNFLTIENFMLLGKLTHLDLGYNHLLSLDANIFEPLTALEKIYFEGNHLHLFEYEKFLRNNENIKEMGIFGNEWSQSYLKKMSDVLKSNNIKLTVRMNPNEAGEIVSLQTTSHPHHTVHAKTLEHESENSLRSSQMNNWDILIIVVLCLVILILCLQIFQLFKEGSVIALLRQGIRKNVPSRRLNEEESGPL